MNAPVKFVGGRNIAMKVPPHLYEATVQFYRDVVGLGLIENQSLRLHSNLGEISSISIGFPASAKLRPCSS
jgi:hypothetical protein